MFFCRTLIMLANKIKGAILILLLQLASCERTKISSTVVTIKLNAIAIVLNEGETYQLDAVIQPADKRTIIWSSDNAEVCSVSDTGLVTALSAGDAVVFVKVAEMNVSSSCQIHVKDKSHSDNDGADMEFSELDAPDFNNEKW